MNKLASPGNPHISIVKVLTALLLQLPVIPVIPDTSYQPPLDGIEREYLKRSHGNCGRCSSLCGVAGLALVKARLFHLSLYKYCAEISCISACEARVLIFPWVLDSFSSSAHRTEFTTTPLVSGQSVSFSQFPVVRRGPPGVYGNQVC